MTPKKELLDIEKLTYENAFNELNALVNSLESDEHTLEEAMQLFERGQALSQRCASLLDLAELKVKQLSGENILDLEFE
jgi:exodeoxyribonuclease VII small subunit